MGGWCGTGSPDAIARIVELEAERDRLRTALAIVEWAPGCQVSDDCDPDPYCQVCRAAFNEFNPEGGHFDECKLAALIGAPLLGRHSPRYKPAPAAGAT